MRRGRGFAGAVISGALLLGGCAGLGAPEPMASSDQRLAGSILSIDVEAWSLKLTDKGFRHEVRLAPEVTIRSGRTERRLADLQRGDRIVIVSRDSESRATWIAVSGPPLKRAREGAKE